MIETDVLIQKFNALPDKSKTAVWEFVDFLYNKYLGEKAGDENAHPYLTYQQLREIVSLSEKDYTSNKIISHEDLINDITNW